MRFVQATTFHATIFGVLCLMLSSSHSNPLVRPATVQLVGDGRTDNSESLQTLIDRGQTIHLSKGKYLISKTIEINLDKTGPTSITSDGTATIIMNGPGPAVRFKGTHQGTAAPHTVSNTVWQKERTPMVQGVEIVGDHPDANGIEALGTMQLTISRVTIRKTVHAVHLVKRNRNVLIANSHIYQNQGIGIFLDEVNLHQINVVNCHISYNSQGGIVARKSELRNLQIGSCDIEGNMGGPNSAATANVLLDSQGASIGEVAIVGCTIQHSHDAPNSANIRINGKSNPRNFTSERRHGNVTIADNVLSDVQVNLELDSLRAVTVSGNTAWKGYTRNVIARDCKNLVFTGNVFDRNPRYHYGDGSEAKLGLEFHNLEDCSFANNHVYASGGAVAVSFKDCRRLNLIGFTILDSPGIGLKLDKVSLSRVSDCLIHNDSNPDSGEPLLVIDGEDNQIVNNLIGPTGKIPSN